MDATIVLIFAAVQALIVVGGNYYLSAEKRKRIQRWCAMARTAGMDEVVPEAGRWSSGLLSGRAGAHRVRLEDLGPPMEARTVGSVPGERVRLILEGHSGITL